MTSAARAFAGAQPSNTALNKYAAAMNIQTLNTRPVTSQNADVRLSTTPNGLKPLVGVYRKSKQSPSAPRQAPFSQVSACGDSFFGRPANMQTGHRGWQTPLRTFPTMRGVCCG